jgi:hypothetical protein
VDLIDPTAEHQLIETAAQREVRARAASQAWQAVESTYRSAYEKARNREIDRPEFDQAKAVYEIRKGQYQRFLTDYEAFYAAHAGLREQVEEFYRSGAGVPPPAATGAVPAASALPAAPPLGEDDESSMVPRSRRGGRVQAPTATGDAGSFGEEPARPIYNDYDEPAKSNDERAPRPKAERSRSGRTLPRGRVLALIGFGVFFALIMLLALIVKLTVHPTPAVVAPKTPVHVTPATAVLAFDVARLAKDANLKETTTPAGSNTTRLADATDSSMAAYSDVAGQTFLIASGTFSSAEAAQTLADDATHAATGGPSPFDERRLDGKDADTACSAELLRAGATIVIVTPASLACKDGNATPEQLAPVGAERAKIVDAIKAQVTAANH